jgi:hypothetical protein
MVNVIDKEKEKEKTPVNKRQGKRDNTPNAAGPRQTLEDTCSF